MRLPENLQTALDAIVQKSSPTQLRKARESLTGEYRQGGTSHSVFADEAQRLAYLAARFPATYAAVFKALAELDSVKTVLDLGAGPGTASWAAAEWFPTLESVALIEKSPGAIELGKELSLVFPHLKSEWIQRDLESEGDFASADLAILSYAIGELKHPERLIERLWQSDIKTILIIEPGTPRGYRTILKARDQLIKSGAHILAPCPHAFGCPLKEGDWCHFSVRIERTRLHRMMKEGTLGYEDEKFSYLAVSREGRAKPGSRILRHPMKGSGHVKLALCTPEGENASRTITKSDKEHYRSARDAEWGGQWM